MSPVCGFGMFRVCSLLLGCRTGINLGTLLSISGCVPGVGVA